MRNVTGNTKILAIIGHPVGHSLSPVMQNTALAACGLDYIYVPFDVAPDRLATSVSGLRALGVSGFNVTIPHKVEIMAHLDALDESAESAGAVNTVCNIDGKLIGHNTDGDGFVRSLKDDLGFVPGRGTIILAGAGGAARGALAALCRAGANRIVIVNRSLDRAQKLSAVLGERYRSTEIISVAMCESITPYLREAALFVNTTSLGMQQERIPFVFPTEMPSHAKVYDMVYSPQVTPLLRDAAAHGLDCANGLGMLAGQGELAFRIWTGVAPPAGVMKGVLASICIA
ncbi:MAG: shikimate dehydrogenase [Desulfuromonadales bacterium]|nr:shikimate dehydrogenase [Desulfuromonadales bacterium]